MIPLFRLIYLLLAVHIHFCMSVAYDEHQWDEMDSQEVDEALMKIHFSLMTESRHIPEVKNQLDADTSASMDREEFELLVKKINDEVTTLKSQALILSRAYQALHAKYKKQAKQLAECSSQNSPIAYGGSNQANVPQPVYNNIPTSVTKPRPPTVHPTTHGHKPEACNCSCQNTRPVSHEYNTVGNTFNYYIYGGRPSFGDQQQPFSHHSYPAQQNGFAGPSYQSNRPNWGNPNDPDDPDASSDDLRRRQKRPLETLQDLRHHLDPKIERWKKKFFDRYELRKLEKLYSPDEVRSLFNQWQQARI
ncbi:uncharacterized protein LOC129723584 [Wyeomyia smithii]|uniref:uncharacterized protein LOC129723584 n=1 Tax=Wyeomyia smithii TaxID=174621 RepID=UPI002467CAF9|nr:uncharacterized protein LOC129723584 [Wyeomyia smithii]